jgi:hypothetical protein
LDIRQTFEEYVTFDNYRNVLQGTKGKHIFLEHLRLKHKKTSITFDDFIVSLRLLNINKLKQLSLFLEQYNFNINDFEAIIRYLEAIKRNIQDFRTVLQINLQR